MQQRKKKIRIQDEQSTDCGSKAVSLQIMLNYDKNNKLCRHTQTHCTIPSTVKFDHVKA